MKQDLSSAAQLPQKPEKSDQMTPEKNLYEPYSTPRSIYEPLRNIVILLFAGIARIQIKGRYNLPRKGPYIVASNHLSWTDIPLVAQYVPGKVVYMAKEESFHSKIGWLVRFLGAFPVKRGEADRQALRTADTLLKDGKTLVIFPEGTRSKEHALGKGFAGLGMIALRSGAPVVPVAIWGSEKALKHFRPSIHIVYGEPLVLKPKGAKVTRADIDEATEEIMQHIAAMLPAQYRGIYAEGQDRSSEPSKTDL